MSATVLADHEPAPYTNREAKRRENNFGFLRLLFGALVVLSHSSEFIYGDRSREILTRIFHTLSFGELAVDGFFLVSGYLVTKSCDQTLSSAQYLLKRVLRIYPGYLVCYFICLFVFMPLGGGSVHELLVPDNFIGVLGRALFLQIPPTDGTFSGSPMPLLNGSMWTLAYEFDCYLAILVFKKLGLFSHRWAYAIITIFIYTLIFVGYGADPSGKVDLTLSLPAPFGGYIDNIRIFSAIRFLGVFLSGGAFYVFRDKIIYRHKAAAVCALVFCLFMNDPRFCTIGAAVFGGYAIFWFAFRTPVNILSKANNKIDFSYGLYLYAWPVQQLIIWYCRGISPYPLFFLSLATASLIGGVSWLVVERNALRLAKRDSREL